MLQKTHFFHLSSQLKQKLDLYCQEMVKWNKTTDLIGNSTLDDIYHRHIMDSLQLLTFLHHNDKIILDVGTGAGLPGIICALYDPDRHYILYEKKPQKMTFLKHITALLELKNITIHGSFSAEKCPKADILTSRALLNVTQIDACLPYVKRAILFKGKNVLQEITQYETAILKKGYFKDSYFVIIQ